MKTITYDDFISFRPCWLESAKKMQQAKDIAAQKERWTALDVLSLDEVDASDRLWLAVREQLIDETTLHEFACVCADRMLSHTWADSRSVRAVEVKRKWLQGDASDEELDNARKEARDVFYKSLSIAWNNTAEISKNAAWAACVASQTNISVRAFSSTIGDGDTVCNYEWQVKELKKMLEEK